MPLSLPQQFKTARTDSNGNVSDTPTYLSAIEQVAALALGITADSDITAAAIGLSNDGKKVSVNKHLAIGSGSAPSITKGLGAGTTPTLTISGTDFCGTIVLVPDTDAQAPATVCTVTFADAYAAVPRVFLWPASGDAVDATIGESTLPQVYVPGYPRDGTGTLKTTQFTLHCSNALDHTKTYVWNYLVIG